MSISSLLYLSLNIHLALSKIGFGPCPSAISSIDPIISLKNPNFIYSRNTFSPLDYLGTWHDIYRTKDFRFAKGNCTQAYYFIDNEGKVVALNSELVNGVNNSAKAEVFIDPEIQGQLYAKFHHLAPAGDYKVVHTDYKSTALVFSCRSILVMHWKWAWILGRDTKVKPPEFYFEMIEEFGISVDEMARTVHEDCLLG